LVSDKNDQEWYVQNILCTDPGDVIFATIAIAISKLVKFAIFCTRQNF
jgi:hypothetical protein